MEFWSNKRLTIKLTGPEGRREIKLHQPFARIGSHAGSEVVLGGPDKRSLYLHATDEGLFCLDLRDYGNGGPASVGQWLTPEAQLTVGDYSLLVAVDPHPCDVSPTPNSLTARGTLERPHPAFRITCKSGPKARYKLSRALTVVGRDVKMGLNLYGSLVSAPHCILYSRNGRVWCVDLLSGNGTLLNGERCDRFEVLPDHQLQVGEFRLTYCGLLAQSSLQLVESAEGSRPEDAPGGQEPELAQQPAGSEEQVKETGTVRLGKGDTVTVPPDISAPPSSDVVANPPAPVSRPQTGSPAAMPPPPVAPAASSTNSWAAKLAEQETRANQLAREIEALQKKWEEQQAQLVELRQSHTNSREQWQSEVNDLRKQLKVQAREIHLLATELGATRAILADQVARTAAAPAIIPAERRTDGSRQPDGESDRCERETVATLNSVFPTVSWNVQKLDPAEKVDDHDASEGPIPPLLDCKPKMKLP